MTDTNHPLGEYDGRPVLAAAMQIRNTGDGLSEAMAVEPVYYPIGTKLHVVLEVEIEKHRHDEIKDAGGALTLVHMAKAGRATVIDSAAVRKALDTQEKKIAEASGEPQLDLEDEEDAE